MDSKRLTAERLLLVQERHAACDADLFKMRTEWDVTHVQRADLLLHVESQAAELAAKDAEIARLREECDEYVAEMARLNFKAIECREALRPFAEAGELISKEWSDHHPMPWLHSPEILHFRAAAKALADGEKR